MKQLTDNEADLLGEACAYKVALEAALKGHPYLPWLAARFAASKEREIAVLLGEEVPDRARASFEATMDAIVARLPSRAA